MGKNRLPVSPWAVLMSGAAARLQKVLSRPVLSPSKRDVGRTYSHHLSSLTLAKSLLLASRFAAVSTLIATITATSAGTSASTGTSNNSPDPATTRCKSVTNRNPSTYTSAPNSFSRKFSWSNLLGWDRTLPNNHKYKYGTHDPQGHLHPSTRTATRTRTTDTASISLQVPHGERAAASPYFNLAGHLDDLSSLIRPFLACLDPFSSSLSSPYSMASYAFSTSSSGSDLSTPRSSSPHSSASVASARSSHSSTFSAAKRMSISSVRRTSASNPMSSVDLSTIEEALRMANLDTLRGYCQNNYGEVHQETNTEYIAQEDARGYQVLNQPHWNKGKPYSSFFPLLLYVFPFPPCPAVLFPPPISHSLSTSESVHNHFRSESVWPCSHYQSLLPVKALLSCLGHQDCYRHPRLA